MEDALRPPPRGTRRVLVATPLAESLARLDGIVHVIDSLFTKVQFYSPLTNLDAVHTAPVSKAAAARRAAIAGRSRPGHCFRLCTEAAFEVRKCGSVAGHLNSAILAHLHPSLSHSCCIVLVFSTLFIGDLATTTRAASAQA